MYFTDLVPALSRLEDPIVISKLWAVCLWGLPSFKHCIQTGNHRRIRINLRQNAANRPHNSCFTKLFATWNNGSAIQILQFKIACIYTYICIYIYIYICVCVRVYVCMYVCMHACMYVMVWYGMVWYGMVWYVWYGMVWYVIVWYGMVW